MCVCVSRAREKETCWESYHQLPLIYLVPNSESPKDPLITFSLFPKTYRLAYIMMEKS